jgi:hypothetical protein
MTKGEIHTLSPTAKTAVILGVAFAGVLIAGFSIGYLPARWTIDRLEAQISRLKQRNGTLEQSLRIAELRGAAGLMSYRVNQNNYGAAAELSTGFFNGLRQAMDKTKDETVRQNLQAMLRQRDEITVGLARADPAVKEKLAQMYADFFQIRAEG